LIVDLDNTLYDWVAFFVPALYAMLDEAARVLDVDVDDLRDQLRAIHRRYGNTEHPFALLETAAVERRFPGATAAARRERLTSAFAAFDAVRDQRLRLYPGVLETLATISKTGCRVVGYTEATDANIKPRLRRLGLIGPLQHVYAPKFAGGPHPDGPPGTTANGRADASRPEVPIRRLESGDRKPNVGVLRRIVAELDVPPQRCLYVGDSMERDVRMARHAGVLAAWAAYGCGHDPDLTDRLAAISHRDAGEGSSHQIVGPTGEDPAEEGLVTLTCFEDLLQRFDFSPSPGRQSTA
jgi:phosphoglycolate phosphatase